MLTTAQLNHSLLRFIYFFRLDFWKFESLSTGDCLQSYLTLQLTFTEAPSLVPVIIVRGGAPQSTVLPALCGTVHVVVTLEEEGEEAGLSIGCAPDHNWN